MLPEKHLSLNNNNNNTICQCRDVFETLMMLEIDLPPRAKVEQLSQTGGQVSISVQALGSVVSHV